MQEHRPGQDPVENQLDGILIWAHWPSDPDAFFCNHTRHLVMYLEIRCTSNFQKCDSLVGYIFEFCPPQFVSGLG